MLTDIVAKTLADAPDLSVVVMTRRDVLTALETLDADVVVLTGPPSGLPQLGHDLLARHPWMHVVAIRDDGRESSLYQLRPVERKLGEISPASLLDAVRRVGAIRP